MSDNLPAPISEDEYSAIEAAVMETARGRWFLAEYTRRNRNSDTKLVLDAVTRLESSLKSQPASANAAADIRLDLIDMAEAISRTRQEIRSLQGEEEADRFGDASEELDAVVEATEKATNEILAAAEKIQEAAWVAMERGEAKEECASIDALVIDIYTGCSFQDITGQRINKVVQALRYVESRVNAMIGIWNLDREIDEANAADGHGDNRPDAHLLNGPARRGEETSQDDIDKMMAAAPSVVDPESMLLDWAEDAVPAISMDHADAETADDSSTMAQPEEAADDGVADIFASAGASQHLSNERDADTLDASSGSEIAFDKIDDSGDSPADSFEMDGEGTGSFEIDDEPVLDAETISDLDEDLFADSHDAEAPAALTPRQALAVFS
ncbi:MAG: chemotaxis protein [Rhodobiaceae bacterium]|nr:chemotaxis protein [Rhodobiaceae bacterium]MCC0041472.1 chemotaxis protein [Rhodobiaceae bacterium]